jgi:hypothetical protein
MPRRAVLVLLLCLWAVGTVAQDLGDVQIHGFATQGFLFSSNNNYLTMKSGSGSLQWTEGAASSTTMTSRCWRYRREAEWFVAMRRARLCDSY